MLAKALRRGDPGYSADKYRHGGYEMGHQLIIRDTNTCYKHLSQDQIKKFRHRPGQKWV